MGRFSEDLKIFSYPLRFFGIYPLNFRLDYKFGVCWVWSFLIGFIITFGHLFNRSWDDWIPLRRNAYRIRTIAYFICPFLVSKHIPILTQEIEKFDYWYLTQYHSEGKYRLMNRGYIWSIFTIISFVVSSILAYFLIPINGWIQVREMMITVFSYNFRQIWIYIYIFYCFNVKSRFKDLCQRWCEQVDSIIQSKQKCKFTTYELALEHTRLQYVSLCQIAENVSNCFGYTLCLYIVTISFEIITDIFCYIYCDHHNNLSFFTFLTIDISVLFFVTWISGEVTTEV